MYRSTSHIILPFVGLHIIFFMHHLSKFGHLKANHTKISDFMAQRVKQSSDMWENMQKPKAIVISRYFTQQSLITLQHTPLRHHPLMQNCKVCWNSLNHFVCFLGYNLNLFNVNTLKKIQTTVLENHKNGVFVLVSLSSVSLWKPVK